MAQFHRWSEFFIPTLREAPADAEVASHKLLLRAGYVRQAGSGLHSYLPLGQRSLNKIIRLVREELDKTGQEFLLPASSENEIWGTLTDIARKDLRSYKQLPQIWGYVGIVLWDKPRAKSGLLRARQSFCANSCSFDIDAEGAQKTYNKHAQAVRRILERCRLDFKVVEASGADDGYQSEAFVALDQPGDDAIVRCQQCDYSATIDSSTSAIDAVEDLPPEGDGAPLLVHTPEVKTIDDLARFLDVSPKNNMKTLAYIAENAGSEPAEPKRQAVVAFLRGDHQLNEAKLSKAIGGRPFRPMEAAEIVQTFGSPAGFLGPIGLTVAQAQQERFGPGTIVLVDRALEGRRNLIAGANREHYHLKNVTPGKDFRPTAYVDLRSVNPGDACPKCTGRLEIKAALEVARVARFTTGAGAAGVGVLDRNGKQVPVLAGRSGIGIVHLLISCVEQNHDADGFWLPPAIAPFGVIVTTISARDEKATSAAVNLCETLLSSGVDVLLDDRDERPGVKFKDADLVGIPYRINVGKKVTEGTVEVVNRSTHETRDVSITAIAEYMRDLLRPAL